MRDFRGKYIVEGDEVILMVPEYRSFTIGTVETINKKKLTIVFKSKHGSNRTTYRYPNAVLLHKRKEDVRK